MNRADWLKLASDKKSQRDRTLLERASKTLELNIVNPADEPAPWAPLRCIRPSKYSYEGIWNWDSAFHAMAVGRWDKVLAQEQITLFLQTQQPSGSFIDVYWSAGSMVTDFGKPPVFPWACEIVDRINQDDKFLAQAYEHFVKYEEFWRRERGGSEDGLFHYGAAGNDPKKRISDAALESGWDNSPRWDLAGCDLWAIDLNCFMIMLYRAMQYMADRLGRKDHTGTWRDREQALAKRVNEALWDAKAGAYCDVHRCNQRSTGVLTPASFMPLFVNIAPPDRIENMAAVAASETKFFPGMPTVAYDHPAYERHHYWRGPVWLNVAYFALKGLKQNGHGKLADEMRDTILNWCYANDDFLYEYYDTRTGKGIGAKQFGWTAAFVIEFILNWEAP